ncbi:MAG: helix-turn-helix transcriptional regulator [Burkholderiales bacterium]|nr:helix-turn-helix transcriptional regulator [Burkholderiales bacterium]
MENTDIDHDAVDRLMARRLKDLRADRGWSLDELARRSGVSRATLSRLENHEVSATTAVLSKLCAAYGLTMSRLMRMVEDQFQPVVRPAEQPLWIDPDKGFRRRSISPPAQSLVGEVLQCELPPNTCIDYDDSPRPGLEHHLVLLEGRLDMTVGGERHALQPGDCLRYQLFGPSSFVTGAEGARYFLFLA